MRYVGLDARLYQIIEQHPCRTNSKLRPIILLTPALSGCTPTSGTKKETCASRGVAATFRKARKWPETNANKLQHAVAQFAT